MARNKETLVLLLDVGPAMHNFLPDIEKVCSLLVQKKSLLDGWTNRVRVEIANFGQVSGLIYSKYDEVGIVLFGAEETNNELTKEVGGYEHVSVLQHIKVVDGDLIETCKQIPKGTVGGDFLDAIVVGMDMLIKKCGSERKGKKRLCLITNAQYPIKESYEGTKADQVSTIGTQMTAHGMKLDCIVVRGKQGVEANESIMDENDALLKLFSTKVNSKTIYVENQTSLLGALRTRNISPVTVFRGDLELSPAMKIKIWVYKKTSEEKFPTLKSYSDRASESNKLAIHGVKLDYEYKSEDSTKDVAPEQRIKGYRYGPQVIPISSAEMDTVKFKPEKSVKLLGFTDASNIMRHYYMKDVNLVIAEPGNTRAILAASALARAMNEMNKVAILRCVWRQGQGNVVVGVLTPNISNKDNVPDSFYFNVLPFAEDIREFQFPSFSSLPSTWQPNDEQQEAADKFVMMLDLAPSGTKEILQPDVTPNPVLERFYHYLELKSKHPDAAVPPLDSTLKKIIEPNPELVSEAKTAIDVFRKCFELKEKAKLRKRRFLREKGSDDERNEHISNPQDMVPYDGLSTSKIDKIGDVTPIQDFEAMMCRRDSPVWINKAIKMMKNKIYDLVEDSYEGDNYSKAQELLVALRKGCILEQEPKQFNDFLRHVCKFCQENDLKSFCEFLASKGISLIAKTEAPDSDVLEDEARGFLTRAEADVVTKNEPTAVPKKEDEVIQ